MRRGGHAGAAERSLHHQARRLRGGHLGRAGEEEGLYRLLRMI